MPSDRLDEALEPILREEILDRNQLREWVIEARDAMKMAQATADVTCRECGKRQKVPVPIRDWQGPKMILELLDRVWGKPNQAPPPEPAPEAPVDVRDVSGLSDEQLRRLARELGRVTGES